VRNKGKLAIIEATRFWAREDAIDEERKDLDINVLRPVGQLGGTSYARVSDTFEVERLSWKQAMARNGEGLSELTGSKA
jgi:hypothetical protein